MSLACVGSTHSVPATLGLPLSRVCALPVDTAQAPSCSTWSGPCVACGTSFPVIHKIATSGGPAFCAFPARAAQAARSLTGALSPGAVGLIPSRVPASISARVDRVRLVSVLGSQSLAATLLADVNHPESQEVFGQKLEACLQFGRGCHLWGQVCPFPLPPASCLQWGIGQSAAGQLFAGIVQSLFCEWSAVCSVSALFPG